MTVSPIVIHVLIHLGVGSGAYLEIPSKKKNIGKLWGHHK